MSDRTARARIRDAAIARFANEGFAATNVKDIAADAGVSPALVIHHFDSKDGLRAACDSHVAALVREQKSAAMSAGSSMDPLESLRQFGDDPPVMRYLARTLSDGSPAVNDLVDQMVADAQEYMQLGVESGIIKPTDNMRDLSVVVTLWSLGSLVLHDHARRLMGVDMVDGGPEERLRWMAAAAPIFTDGILDATVMKQIFANYESDTGVENTRPDPPAAV
jgi:AcrR family transcriptional regulator